MPTRSEGPSVQKQLSHYLSTHTLSFFVRYSSFAHPSPFLRFPPLSAGWGFLRRLHPLDGYQVLDFLYLGATNRKHWVISLGRKEFTILQLFFDNFQCLEIRFIQIQQPELVCVSIHAKAWMCMYVEVCVDIHH